MTVVTIAVAEVDGVVLVTEVLKKFLLIPLEVAVAIQKKKKKKSPEVALLVVFFYPPAKSLEK